MREIYLGTVALLLYFAIRDFQITVLLLVQHHLQHYYAMETTLSPVTPTTPNGAPPEYTEEDAAQLFGAVPLAPPRSSLRILDVPVALPQTSNSYDAPFSRGWDPLMEESGVEMVDWLRFIDGLNIAMVCACPGSNVRDVSDMVYFVIDC